MSGMVERVARAMVARQDNDWDQLDGGDHGYFVSLASAAIKAMREPTRSICEAMEAEDRGRTDRVWVAAIDAALRD